MALALGWAPSEVERLTIGDALYIGDHLKRRGRRGRRG